MNAGAATSSEMSQRLASSFGRFTRRNMHRRYGVCRARQILDKVNKYWSHKVKIRRGAGIAQPTRTTRRSARKLHRVYAGQVSQLEERHLRAPFSVAEGRILYELGARKRVIAAEHNRELDMDFDYLSRSPRS